MSEERRKVLDLLASGTISSEEAERLLEKLGAKETSPPRYEDDSIHAAIDDVHAAIEDVGEVAKGIGTKVWGWEWPNRRKPRYFRIEIQDQEGEDVNIRLPMGLVRTGLKVSTMVPNHVEKRLRDSGVDLSALGELDDAELSEKLRDLNVDVASSDGGRVRVYCE